MPAIAATIPEVKHAVVSRNGQDLHYVTAGETGTPILLVHGFPESWWAFHKLIPLLARHHRVIAVDLPGFGDSGTTADGYTSTTMAEALRDLIIHLDLGPVHLSGQDIGGTSAFRLAAGHPGLVRSLTAIETALPGYGFEKFADVANGGVWHVGFLAAPGIPDMLLQGRMRQFLTDYAYPVMNRTPGAIDARDVTEFERVYSRDGGLLATNGVYAALLTEGAEIRALVADHKLVMPVLAVDAGSGPFTSGTMAQVAENVSVVTLQGVGHLVAMEAPAALAEAMLAFYKELDAWAGMGPAQLPAPAALR